MIFRVIVKLGAMEYLILQNGLNATRCSRCAGAASRHPLPSPVFGFRYLIQSGLTTCLYAAERTAKGDRPSQGRDALRPPFAPLHLAQHVSSSRCPFLSLSYVGLVSRPVPLWQPFPFFPGFFALLPASYTIPREHSTGRTQSKTPTNRPPSPSLPGEGKGEFRLRPPALALPARPPPPSLATSLPARKRPSRPFCPRLPDGQTQVPLSLSLSSCEEVSRSFRFLFSSIRGLDAGRDTTTCCTTPRVPTAPGHAPGQ